MVILMIRQAIDCRLLGLLLIFTGYGQGDWIELIYPRDGDTIESVTPAFMWLPVVSGLGGVVYEVRVVESWESPMQSIGMRRPYVMGTRLGQTQFVYPVGARPLERGQWYAWQVRAYLPERPEPVAYSEVYRFYVRGKSLERDSILSPYIEVSAELEGKYVYAVSDTVSLSIEEPLNVEVVSKAGLVGERRGQAYRLVQPKKVERVHSGGIGRRYLYGMHLEGEGFYEVQVESAHGMNRFYIVRVFLTLGFNNYKGLIWGVGFNGVPASPAPTKNTSFGLQMNMGVSLGYSGLNLSPHLGL